MSESIQVMTGIYCSDEGLSEFRNEILAAILVERTRDAVADLYETGLLIRPLNRVNWAEINQAILTRWSVSGLTYIKKHAWKRIERSARVPTTS